MGRRTPTRTVVAPEAPKASPVLPASGPSPSRSVGPLDVRCRYCGSPPGYKCRDRITRKEHEVPHDSRANDPTLLRWYAWHGNREVSRRVPPL